MSQLSVDFDNNLQRSVTFIYLKGKDYSLLLRGLYFFRNLLFGSNLWYKSIGVTRIFYYCEIFYYSEVYYCEIPLYNNKRKLQIFSKIYYSEVIYGINQLVSPEFFTIARFFTIRKFTIARFHCK